MKIWRKGQTAKTWSNDPYNGKISARPGLVRIRFSMPSKGSGVTEVLISFGPNDFSNLAKAMGIADDAAALRAVGEFFIARAAATADTVVKPSVAGFQTQRAN